MNLNNTTNSQGTILVIFGITGDLAQRYLLPSLYHLFKDGLLDENTEILGVTRGDMTVEELFQSVELCVNEIDKVCDPVALKAMHDRTNMFKMDLKSSASYQSLLNKLNGIEETKGLCMNRLYYLSIPPASHKDVIEQLGKNSLNTSCQHDKAATRILVEKPFGYDLDSAIDLIKHTDRYFSEKQVFRIDHYIAKETVQSLLKFRFDRHDLAQVWDKNHIAGIDIIAKEKIGIEGRVDFYEPLGALRDFVQSHLLQLLGIVTMNKPEVLDSKHIHKLRSEALDLIEPVPDDKISERVVRGQYSSYRQEVGNPKSTTETFVSLEVYSQDSKWQNVPLKLLTGKALDERITEVIIKFKETAGIENNELVFKLHSDSGHPNAYERVLIDAVRGDHTVFATSQEILASWRIVQPVLNSWANDSSDLKIYDSGSSGPKSA